MKRRLLALALALVIGACHPLPVPNHHSYDDTTTTIDETTETSVFICSPDPMPECDDYSQR